MTEMEDMNQKQLDKLCIFIFIYTILSFQGLIYWVLTSEPRYPHAHIENAQSVGVDPFYED